MKKSIKILITSCVVAVGVGASFGGAFALYTKNANPTEFSIGTYTHTSSGTVTYKIGDVVNSMGTQKIDPDHKSFTLKAPLGGTYSNDIPAQSVVYGKFSVKATISSQLVDKVEWSVYIDGYKDNVDEYEVPHKTYWSNWDKDGDGNLAPRKLTDGDETLEKTETTVSHYLAVEAVANPVITEEQVGQVACIYVNFFGMNESNFLDCAEGSIKFDITFDEPVGADIPLIKGDKTAWSDDALEYRMVPNIEAENFEWKFDNLAGFEKLLILDARHDGENVTTYYVKAKTGGDEDGNIVANKENTYSVYYKGSSGESGDRYDMIVDGEHNIIYQA